MVRALEESGARVIHVSEPDRAPFRITAQSPNGERFGICAYAFYANRQLTKNRPANEHRFQLKYGSKDGGLHELWQDPTGLYTTIFVGINPELGFFVGADPVLHSPTRMFISVEFKDSHANAALERGWTAWERERRGRGTLEPVEVLVAGTARSFLQYVEFERAAVGLDQGHRMLLAERPELIPSRASPMPTPSAAVVPPVPPSSELHRLEQEFELSNTAILDLIQSAPRLKMAVRGWVAEEHLVAQLSTVPGVTECQRLEADGGPDVQLRYLGSRPLTVECKNVLRDTNAFGLPRMDFQRTRASKGDPCSRYYRADDFDIVAACLHPVVQRWDFAFRLTHDLAAHKTCSGRVASNVVVDAWAAEVTDILEAALS